MSDKLSFYHSKNALTMMNLKGGKIQAFFALLNIKGSSIHTWWSTRIHSDFKGKLKCHSSIKSDVRSGSESHKTAKRRSRVKKSSSALEYCSLFSTKWDSIPELWCRWIRNSPNSLSHVKDSTLWKVYRYYSNSNNLTTENWKRLKIHFWW